MKSLISPILQFMTPLLLASSLLLKDFNYVILTIAFAHLFSKHTYQNFGKSKEGQRIFRETDYVFILNAILQNFILVLF